MTEIKNKRWIGAAAFTGGLLWVAHYALQLGYGLSTGRVLFEAGHTVWGKVDGLAFFGAYLSIGLALTGLAHLLTDYLKGWRRAGVFFASGPILAGLVGIGAALLPSDLAGAVYPICGKVGIVALFLSAIFTGSGLYRANDMNPEWVSVFLVLFGWFTAPVAMLLMPLEQTIPSYVITEAHFAVVGAVWMILGGAFLSRQSVLIPSSNFANN